MRRMLAISSDVSILISRKRASSIRPVQSGWAFLHFVSRGISAVPAKHLCYQACKVEEQVDPLVIGSLKGPFSFATANERSCESEYRFDASAIPCAPARGERGRRFRTKINDRRVNDGDGRGSCKIIPLNFTNTKGDLGLLEKKCANNWLFYSRCVRPAVLPAGGGGREGCIPCATTVTLHWIPLRRDASSG